MTTIARSFDVGTAHFAVPVRASSDLRTWRRRVLELVTALAAASQQMSFIEHLEELRKRLIWSVAFLGVAFVVCWTFAGDLYDVASAPIRANSAVTLSVSRPQDIFSLYMTVTLAASIFLSAPFVLLQAWLFIAPGLYAHERRYAIPFVLSASVFFGAGGAFGYFVAFPTALTFLLDWIVQSHLVPIIDAGEYFNLFFSIIVALGIVFQIPPIVFVLSRIGLVDAHFLVTKLKYALFICVVVAALVTPTTDPWNMLVIAGPMVFLYCIGIIVAWLFGRHRSADTKHP
jgi:sec-independent protein translocase protein TatC